MEKHIVLVGPSAVEKISVGMLLSAKLKIPFSNMDKMLLDNTGHLPEDYRNIFGPLAFRDMESKLLVELLHDEPRVISTGDGIVYPCDRGLSDNLVRKFSETNLHEIIRDNVFRFYLKESKYFLKKQERLFRMTSGEIISDNSRKRLNRIKELLSIRRPYYEQADKTISTDNINIGEIRDKIISYISDNPR